MKDEKYYLVEKKGEVEFYENKAGEQYQKLIDFNNVLLKVVDGEIVHEDIMFTNIKNMSIKYNLNGIYGYSIWRKDKCLEDRFWSLNDVLEALKHIPNKL